VLRDDRTGEIGVSQIDAGVEDRHLRTCGVQARIVQGVELHQRHRLRELRLRDRVEADPPDMGVRDQRCESARVDVADEHRETVEAARRNQAERREAFDCGVGMLSGPLAALLVEHDHHAHPLGAREPVHDRLIEDLLRDARGERAALRLVRRRTRVQCAQEHERERECGDPLTHERARCW
jgi:hypothetical protein